MHMQVGICSPRHLGFLVSDTVLRSTYSVQEVQKVLHLRQNNPKHQYQVANQLGEQRPPVKGLGAVVVPKMNMSKWWL